MATLIADGDELRVEPEGWRERIEQLAGSPAGHSPTEYLAIVVERLADATYVSASEVHTADVCPFAHGEEIGIEAERARDLAGAP